MYLINSEQKTVSKYSKEILPIINIYSMWTIQFKIRSTTVCYAVLHVQYFQGTKRLLCPRFSFYVFNHFSKDSKLYFCNTIMPNGMKRLFVILDFETRLDG